MKNLYLLGALLMCLIGNSQCVTNGDFEAGVTANYTFRINPDTNNFSYNACDINTSAYSTITISSVPNNFTTQGGTLVDGSSTASYGPFDETLFALGTFIHRVSPATGGTQAIKLNNNTGSADITTMTVEVASAPQNIMFDYSIVTQNPHPDNPAVQPFFAVRMYDVITGNMVYNGFCVKADATNTAFTETITGDVLYTDWQCGALVVPAGSVGKNLRLEFVVADCGEGGHFGSVYIDNIRCGTACNVFGKIVLDEIKRSCPDQPFNVCGSFVTPTNASLVNGSITLSLIDINGVPTPLALTPTITGNTFCYVVNPTLFGANPAGVFEFRISADFLGPSGTFELIGASSTLGADVMFDTLSPSLNSFVFPDPLGDILMWDDVDDTYTLEFIADGGCCPDNEQSVTENQYTMTTSDNFINLNYPLANLGTSRCFRWRIKTKCGWSGWCCLAPSSFGTSPTGVGTINILAPNCYEGELCEDTIIILNTTENIIPNLIDRVVDKEISITAHNSVESGGSGIYRAGNFVMLLPAFIAKTGSVFIAEIENCVGEDTAGAESFSTSSYSQRINTTTPMAADSFTVYPNPTQDLINITGKTADVFTIIDINGKEVMRIENKDNMKDFSIDLSRLNTGIYFLTADGKTIQKVIKE